MNYQVNCFCNDIKAAITLPTSKSISNRLLIIQALAKRHFQLFNLSDSDDTQVMLEAFKSVDSEINIGHAGTSMRFLTAYYAATGQNKIITGSGRMKNRPIHELVNALNQLGADIKYAEKTGFPPVVTSGKILTGNNLEINGSISSQFITALLLVAPTLPQGLTIHITGTLISSSYVSLTLGLMENFGIKSLWKDNMIHIEPQEYRGKDMTVEADWSGASYWYEIAALSDNAELKIHGLSEKSLQGDAAVTKIFEKIGITTEFSDNVAFIKKGKTNSSFFEFNFIDNPDLVQTLVVTLCLLDIPFRISGADTLRIKETDRIAALQNEMNKLGYTIQEPQKGTLTWDGNKSEPNNQISIETYKDHRMALAFAPAALKIKNIHILDAGVVSKSYPNYWNDLGKAGFEIKEQND
jgi:3-phosphoshikimate 1-carboxyvinyltransferase